MDGSYWDNVKMSFMPEFISMNAMTAAMAPTMSILMMRRDMRAMDPLEFAFCGVMSLGVMVGFAAAYPFNLCMVKKGIKRGLMTQRPETQPRKAVPKPNGVPLSGHGAPSGRGGHNMRSEATVPQLLALSSVTSFLLVAACIAVPGIFVNLRVSAYDVRGAIMPPGMISTFDLPAEA